MFRNAWLTVFLGAAVFASAQAGVSGALGAGEVTDSNGEKGAFGVAVKRGVRRDGTVVVGGHGHFARRTGNGGVTVNLLRADVVTVDGNTCHAEGRGGYIAVVDGQRTRKEGRVVIDVADNRPPRSTEGDPDTFSITFTATDNSVTYSFSGNVTRGDIRVGSRN